MDGCLGWCGAEWAELNAFTSFGKEVLWAYLHQLCWLYILLLQSGSIRDGWFHPFFR